MRKLLGMAHIVTACLMVGVGTANGAAEASLYWGRTAASGLSLETMSTFGGTIGAYSSFIGAEFGLEYSPTTSFDVGTIEAGASLLHFMGNVVVQVPAGPVYPYGTVGYGGIVTGTDASDWPFDFLGGTVGALNFGLGVKVYFSENVGLRVDYRRIAIQKDEDPAELRIPFTDIMIDANPDLDRLIIGAAFRW